jgi:hypothetical protein
MRCSLPPSLAAVLVCATAASLAVAGSPGAAAAPSHAIASTAAGYNFKARVRIDMTVNWNEWTDHVPCATWRSAAGKSRVHVVGSVSGRYGPAAHQGAQTAAWIDLWGLGKPDDNPELAFSRRRLIEASGVEWGTGCPPPRPPNPAIPSNDCEPPGVGTFRQLRGQLTMVAGRRASEATLDALTDTVDNGRHRVISVSALPLRGWYRKCRVHRQAPDLPANLAVLVDDVEARKLRALQPNQTLSIRYDSGVAGALSCGPPAELGTTETCTGFYSVEIALRRIRSRESFP